MATSIFNILFKDPSEIQRELIRGSSYKESVYKIYLTLEKVDKIVRALILIGITSLGIILFNLHGLFIGKLTVQSIIIPTIVAISSFKGATELDKKFWNLHLQIFSNFLFSIFLWTKINIYEKWIDVFLKSKV